MITIKHLFSAAIIFICSLVVLMSCQKPLVTKKPAEAPSIERKRADLPEEEIASFETLEKRVRSYLASGHVQLSAEQGREESNGIRSNLKSFLSKHPNTTLTDNVLYYLGRLDLLDQQFNSSASYFKQIVDQHPDSDVLELAKYHYGLCFIRMKRLAEAVPVIETMKIKSFPEAVRPQALRLLARGYQEIQAYDRLVETQLIAYQLKQGNLEIKEEVIGTIDRHLNAEQLAALANRYGKQFPGGYALMRLAKYYIDNQEYPAAVKSLKQFTGRFPVSADRHEFSIEAAELLERFSKIDEVKPRRIGVLLPLSGKFKNIGLRMLSGIMLASDLYGTQQAPSNGGEKLSLIIKDTAGDPEQALRSLETLVLDYQVAAIIGPALIKTSEAVMKAVDQFNVPTIVLSQGEQVALESSFIFQNGLLKSSQVQALASYAVEHLGAKRIAMLYPEHSYGQDMFWQMWNLLKEKYPEVEIRGVEAYERDKDDFGPEIRRLVGLFYIKPRKDELCSADTKKKNPDAKCFEREELPPIVDFEVLFIPDSAQKIRQIAPALSYYGVRGVQLLGGNLWNDPLLLKDDSSNYLQGAVYVDAFNLNSQEKPVVNFLSSYKKEFKHTPDLVAAQAYDAMKVLSIADQNHALLDRKAVRKYLREMNPIHGAMGKMSFEADGRVRRPLYYFMVDGKKARLLTLNN